MEEIEELCSKVFIIDLGKEIAYGTKEQIKALSGEQTKVIFKLNDSSAELLLQLKQLTGVLAIDEVPNQVSLTVNSEFKLTNAISLLEAAHIELHSISYEQPRLEDIFLWLTGKSLRD